MPSLSRSLVTCGLLLLGSAAATAKQKTPKEIIEEATDQTAFRAKGIEMQMIMRLKDKSGSTRDRTMYARAQRKDGLSKTLVRFLAPADVAGTSFLFVENKTRDDDQYMYLPALK
ncbi:MAG: outer membrane lipoprotein-sorting protein, partial [Planctomycetales bacterium]|nr:outer membrane lipoprotein-sorting protein [Planctomycetales bacterium]